MEEGELLEEGEVSDFEAPSAHQRAPEPPFKRRRRFEDSVEGSPSGILSPSHSAGRNAVDAVQVSPKVISPAGMSPIDLKEAQRRKDIHAELTALYVAYAKVKQAAIRGGQGKGAKLSKDAEAALKQVAEATKGLPEVAQIAASILPRYAVLSPSYLKTAFEFLCNLCTSSATESNNQATAVEVVASAYGGLVELLVRLNAGVRDGSLAADEASEVSQKVALFLLEKQGDESLPQPTSTYPPGENDDIPFDSTSFSPSDPYGYLASVVKKSQSGAATSARLACGALASGFIEDPCLLLKAALCSLDQSEQEQAAFLAVHFLECILTTEFPEEPTEAENGEPEEGEVAVNELPANGHGKRDTWISAVLHPRPLAERWLIQAVRQSRAAAKGHWALLERMVAALESADALSLADISEEEARAGVPAFYTENAQEEDVKEAEEITQAPETEASKDFSAKEVKREDGGAEVKLPQGEQTAPGGEKRVRDRTPPRRRERSSSRDSQDSWATRRGRKSEREKKKRRYSSSESEGLGRRIEAEPSVQKSLAQASWGAEGDPKAFDVFPASRHLWVGSLIKGVTDEMLRQTFEKYGRLEKATAVWNKHHGFIDFFKVQDAVRAREALQGEPVWGHQRIALRFSDGGRRKSPERGGSAVWVGNINSQSAKEDLLRDLKAGGVREAQNVSVLLSASALLLEYESAEEAAAAIAHIRMRRGGGAAIDRMESLQRGGKPASDPPPRARSRERFEGSRARSRERARSSSRSKSRSSSKARRARAASRDRGDSDEDEVFTNPPSLWVGRVDGRVPEEEMLTAFRQFGPVIDWRFLRQSQCCFINYEHPREAAAAKMALSGALFGSLNINIEFKRPRGGRSRAQESPPRSRAPRFSFGGEPLATNTLFVGYPQRTDPELPTQKELERMCEIAAASRGTVTNLRSARTIKGPCLFIEFSSVEAASAVLEVLRRKLDASMQVKYSHSAQSLEKTEQQQQKQARAERRRSRERRSSPDAPRSRRDSDASPVHERPKEEGETRAERSLEAELDETLVAELESVAVSPGEKRKRSDGPDLAQRVKERLRQSLQKQADVSTPAKPQTSEAAQTEAQGGEFRGPILWEGPLCKSSAPYCHVAMFAENVAGCRYEGSVHEPAGWPDRLDITKRSDLRSLLEVTLRAVAGAQKEVCRLVVTNEKSGQGFAALVEYLTSRERAGVVSLPPYAPGQWPRHLHVIPWSARACSLLGVPEEPRNSLLALALPASALVPSSQPKQEAGKKM